MQIEITDDLIRATFPFSADTINRVKRIGLKWQPRNKTWESPFSYQVLDGLAREFPKEFEPQKLPDCNGWEPSAYLMDHQKEAARIALDHSRYGFFDDTGTGKTISALEIVKQKGLKTLVICKLSLIENAWMRDAQNFYPDLSVVNLWEVFKKKKARIPDHDVGIINYESFRLVHPKLIGYQMLIADESSALKDARSQITKALIAYTDKVPYVYLLSGTPAPNNEMEYWSQFRILDQSLLGRSYYSFRNKFCYAGGFGGYTWKMKPDKREEFLELIGQKSRVVRKEDVLDLPERTFNIRTVYLDPKEMAAYRKMENDMLLEIEGQESVAANSAVKIMKLRQGTSGFFYDEDGKAMVVGHSKLNALKELLEEIGNHQVIIWTQFHEEADQIIEMLDHNFVRVDGTISNQGGKDESVKAFMDGEVKYLVSHPASLGHGVTLTNCQYAVYFSLSHSHEHHYQSKDRIYRKGQKNACTYYYLVAHQTVDGEILKCLENKHNAAEAVFAYLKRNRG